MTCPLLSVRILHCKAWPQALRAACCRSAVRQFSLILLAPTFINGLASLAGCLLSSHVHHATPGPCSGRDIGGRTGMSGCCWSRCSLTHARCHCYCTRAAVRMPRLRRWPNKLRTYKGATLAIWDISEADSACNFYI